MIYNQTLYLFIYYYMRRTDTNNVIVPMPYIITNNNFYIRHLTDTLCQSARQSYISLCYYTGLCECLESIESIEGNADKYILCIGYTAKDFQIAITGTCKREELIDNAAKRETFEEADVESHNFELFSKQKFKRNRKIINSYVYKLQANDCMQSTRVRYDSGKISSNDDYTKKITIVLYGSLEEITRIMSSSRLANNNSEKIGFYAAIKISEAITICKQILILRKRHHWKTLIRYISGKT